MNPNWLIKSLLITRSKKQRQVDNPEVMTSVKLKDEKGTGCSPQSLCYNISLFFFDDAFALRRNGTTLRPLDDVRHEY